VAVDRERAAAAVREFLFAIGEDPDREGLLGTPARVARAAEELFAGLDADAAALLATTFDISHQEMLPFTGVAHVAYIPGRDGKVTGLSKLARLVDVYARRPQVQERLTTQIADALVTHLGAAGVMVVVECEHQCMTMRGVRKAGSKTVTSAVRGVMHAPATRAEAMSLILG
jgi:GTP cyclohydrolase I